MTFKSQNHNREKNEIQKRMNEVDKKKRSLLCESAALLH